MPPAASLPARLTQARVRLRQQHPLGPGTERAVVLGLIAVGAAVRLVWLVDVPLGLNQDEAAIGYEAWALLEHGISRHGYAYPVHFVSWGSGQNALYAYLCMPFIWLLGLNVLAVRLPQALLGVAALFAMYAAGRRLVDRRFALCALFVLVVSPWHVMASRWGIESNMLPVLLLFAFALLLRGLERPRYVVPAFALLALALYAYATAYVFVPLFVLGILAYGWRRHFAHIRHWALGLLAMVVVALPMGLFLLVNLLRLPAIELPLLSIPRYTGEIRLSETVFSAQDAPSALRDVWTHAMRAYQILVVDGRTSFVHNALPEFGYFYHRVGLSITLAGALFMVRDLVRGAAPRNLLIVTWLGAGAVVAILAGPHMQRLNVLLVPLLLCAAYGLRAPLVPVPPADPGMARAARWVERTANVARVAAVAYLTISFAAFARHYFMEFGPSTPFNMHPSYAQALAHVVEHADAEDAIYVPKDPLYTAVLFYDPPDPREYLRTVEFREVDVPFQEPLSFGRYRIGMDAEAVASGNAFVVHAGDAPAFAESEFAVVPFDHFSAVIRRR